MSIIVCPNCGEEYDSDYKEVCNCVNDKEGDKILTELAESQCVGIMGLYE